MRRASARAMRTTEGGSDRRVIGRLRNLLAKNSQVQETAAEPSRCRTLTRQRSMKRRRPMSETLTDQVLVERAKRGDEIAFSELVNRHYRRALRVAYGLLKHPEDAADVVQDAFARVHVRLADFEGSSAFYTWLYRIVVNLSIDAMRRRRRERRVDLEDEAARDALRTGEELWPRYDYAHPGDSAERRELGARLQKAFEGLPEIHQAVILLRELEGMSYDEIARTLKIKKGTVMSRLFHARKGMQAKLVAEQSCDDDKSYGSEGSS